jgi:hypothetical protein
MALALALNVFEISDAEIQNGFHVEPIKNAAAALKLISSVRADFHVVLDVPFVQKMISRGRSLASLIGQQNLAEEVRVIMAAANRAPPASLDQGIDVKVSGEFLWAAQMAYQADGLILTIATGGNYRTPYFEATISYLNGLGEVEFHSASVENVFDEDSSRQHQATWEQKGATLPDGGSQEIWRSRHTIFHSIRFLNRVEQDIARLGVDELEQVFSKLLLINRSASEWSSGKVNYPSWRSKITNESDSRRSLCDFLDDSNVTQNYESHARYTPGAGRIHFRCIDQVRIVEVAYIGEKL